LLDEFLFREGGVDVHWFLVVLLHFARMTPAAAAQSLAKKKKKKKDKKRGENEQQRKLWTAVVAVVWLKDGNASSEMNVRVRFELVYPHSSYLV